MFLWRSLRLHLGAYFAGGSILWLGLMLASTGTYPIIELLVKKGMKWNLT